jgi:hypothetical protein
MQMKDSGVKTVFSLVLSTWKLFPSVRDTQFYDNAATL